MVFTTPGLKVVASVPMNNILHQKYQNSIQLINFINVIAPPSGSERAMRVVLAVEISKSENYRINYLKLKK